MSGRWYSSETQIRWVCKQLIAGAEISHMDEIAAVRGWRLSAIIHQLRHRYKWPVVTRFDETRIAHYRMGTDVDAEKLQKPRSYLKPKAEKQPK